MKMVKIMKKMSILKKTIGRRVLSLLLAVFSAGIYAQVPAASTSKPAMATAISNSISEKPRPALGFGPERASPRSGIAHPLSLTAADRMPAACLGKA